MYENEAVTTIIILLDLSISSLINRELFCLKNVRK